jgi:hypothetical protein
VAVVVVVAASTAAVADGTATNFRSVLYVSRPQFAVASIFLPCPIRAFSLDRVVAP